MLCTKANHWKVQSLPLLFHQQQTAQCDKYGWCFVMKGSFFFFETKDAVNFKSIIYWEERKQPERQVSKSKDRQVDFWFWDLLLCNKLFSQEFFLVNGLVLDTLCNSPQQITEPHRLFLPCFYLHLCLNRRTFKGALCVGRGSNLPVFLASSLGKSLLIKSK